jgi:hypothetical protein
MARTRYIRHGFFRNEELAECDPLVRILFAGLWTIADKEGRLEDRPKRIKADVLPYDNCNVEKMLNELERKGFIVRYIVDNVQYICIPTWHAHQKPHNTEAASIYPPPPEHVIGTDAAPIDNGGLTVKSQLDNASLTPFNINSNINSNGELEHTLAAARVPDNFQDWFNEFWELYPRNSDGIRPRKPEAIKAARKVSVADRPKVLQAVRNYAQTEAVQRGIVKYPQGFLNPTYWPDYLEITPKGYTNGNSKSGQKPNLSDPDIASKYTEGYYAGMFNQGAKT